MKTPDKAQTEEQHFKDLPVIIKGAGLTLFGTVAGKGLYLLYTIFLARVLGINDLGLYFLGLSIVFFLGVIGNMGLNAATVRFTSIYNTEEGRRQKLKGITIAASVMSFLFGMVLVAVVFVLADVASGRIFHKPELGGILKVFALSIPFECSMRVLLGSTQGLKLMGYTAITENILWVAARFLLTLVLIYGFDMKLEGAVWAYTVSSVISACAALYFTNRHIPLFKRKDSPVFEYREILKFSLPMAFSETVYNLLAQADVLILGLFMTSSSIGVYSIAVRVVVMAQIVFNIFIPVFNPFISELYEKNNLVKLSKLLKAITRWNVMASFPIFMSIMCFPGVFLRIFGGEFLQASSCLFVLVLARIFTSPSVLPNSMLAMSGRPELQLVNNIILLVLTVILNYVLIPSYGIIGAAVATGTCLVIASLIRIVEVYRLMKIHPFTSSLVKPVVCGLIAFVISYALLKFVASDSYAVNLGIMVIFYVIYAVGTWYMKFNEEDIYLKNLIWNKLASMGRSFV